MLSIAELTTFFGWCSVISVAVLAFTTLFITFAKGFVTGFHSKVFGIDEKELSKVYFSYLANYKIAILMFNIVPYFALKLMS